MLKRTLAFISEKLATEVYNQGPSSPYIAIDQMTALFLLDLLDYVYKMEEQKDGA